MVARAGVGEFLAGELAARYGQLRSPDIVMAPHVLGSARLTRYSFNRAMVRQAVAGEWRVECVKCDVDRDGAGEAVYQVDTGTHTFSFVAFLTTLDESMHTDRVVAGAWEITAALVEGAITKDVMSFLRSQVPLQEEGRLDSRILVLTRGNRSVRFFDYLVQTLAQGAQPDPDLVADAGYIMRSTAFYGNGKYGMRSFAGYRNDHPLRAPYRAQFVAAWLFRELSYDVVESCARQRGGESAVGFDHEWRNFFGLGNATGLGLVPYMFSHPRVIHSWFAIREIALADVRSYEANPERVAALTFWIDRAHRHFIDGTSDDCRPFRGATALVPMIEMIRAAFTEVREAPKPFDALYEWAQTVELEPDDLDDVLVDQRAELTEMVVSMLIELHEPVDDAMFDEMLHVDETAAIDPLLTAGEIALLIEERFGWLDGHNLDAETADAFWWVISDNTEEPRRTLHDRLDEPHQSGRQVVAIDIALRIWRLRTTVRACDPKTVIADLLARHPEHLLAVERLIASDRIYGEPRDNVCSDQYLPLLVQRFQLAFYGMDNFKPKSTDWLRVTLFQGGPRISDLADALADPTAPNLARDDQWVWPARPASGQPTPPPAPGVHA